MEIAFVLLAFLAGLCLGVYVGRAFGHADKVTERVQPPAPLDPKAAEIRRAEAWLHRFDAEDKP